MPQGHASFVDENDQVWDHQSDKKPKGRGVWRDASGVRIYSAAEEADRISTERQEDVHALCRALGIPDVARPISPHEVIQTLVLPAIAELMWVGPSSVLARMKAEYDRLWGEYMRTLGWTAPDGGPHQ